MAAPDNTFDQAASASTQPQSEAEIILQQGYYIVQPGDSMISISKKIYQDASMWQICVRQMGLKMSII